ncbi:MAG: hypothetical protein H6752_17145 [Candidatus Omnitrophica bacterium]|nr:hypothetical protein [Candidatus Omnitrophota bacterium]
MLNGSWAGFSLDQARLLSRGGEIPTAEQTAAEVLVEELKGRFNIDLKLLGEDAAEDLPLVVLAPQGTKRVGSVDVPIRDADEFPENRAEGFRIAMDNTGAQPRLFILGAGGRGMLFGVGYLLRNLQLLDREFPQGEIAEIESSAPMYEIRGHQIGYRARANSWDAWTPEQMETYFREMALFGSNCIENIPFQDEDYSPHMKLPREEMNLLYGEICDKYDLDYWIWSPAEFPLDQENKRQELLDRHEKFFKECVRLDGVFFPGGDPGDNPPELVMPFLKDVAEILHKYHPEAGIWLSMQGFDREAVEWCFEYLRKEEPDWFTGVVCGPSSPPIPLTRALLPKRYKLRHYPDITHTVRCQYPTQWWDPAFNFTLGREPWNPQPVYYRLVHNWLAPYTNGFLTYSDGINDDVNKFVWSLAGWNPNTPVREMLIEYSRFFFGPDLAEEGADAILALERNWEGSLSENGSVDATLEEWKAMTEDHPELMDNWRWVCCLQRAYYDVYTRHRLIDDSAFEENINAVLRQADSYSPEEAMTKAEAMIEEKYGDGKYFDPEMRRRIFDLGDILFKLIGYQTSIPRYQASGTERGCILDFINHPLNNRWWLEDEFKRIRSFKTDGEKIDRLLTIADWENPGPGSFYDDVGNIEKSEHVIRGERLNTDPLLETDPCPGYMWWDNGSSRTRLSWPIYMDWPVGMRYEHLDPEASYTIRITGQGDSLLRIDGEIATHTVYGKKIGEFKEFPIPKEALADGKIELTWDKPDEEHLNWREQSHLAEVWLLKE